MLTKRPLLVARLPAAYGDPPEGRQLLLRSSSMVLMHTTAGNFPSTCHTSRIDYERFQLPF